MVLKVLLIITVLLQMVAVVLAVRMTRMTKFNSSWILFAVALTLMLASQVFDFIDILGIGVALPKEISVWIGVIVSLCFVVAIFYVRKLIYYIAQMDANRRLTEKRILNTIISTEEKERIRFSKDLHDGLGPLLSSVKLSVSALSKMEPDDSRREIIHNADYAIEEAIKSLKEISNNISPHILNNFGVVRAVTNFINKLTLPAYLKINFDTDLRGRRFTSNIEAILYRVICELVNNAIKHADPSRIDISLKLEDKDNIRLTVVDDGCGFVPDDDNRRGMGLSNISSRISSLKGDMKIDSSPGKGTCVSICISVN